MINLKDREIFNFKENERNPVYYLLDERYSKIEHVEGLRTKLFLHQQTIIKAMVDLENKTTYTNNFINCRTNTGILGEPVGAGKTIDILSLILIQKQPKVYRNVMNIEKFIWFKKYKHILRPTLIFVSVSVLSQWKLSIETFTDLTYFMVSDYYSLKKLIDMIYDNSVNDYDIILLKNGTVARVPYNYRRDIKWNYNLNIHTPNIYSIIANLYDICWNRVVVDDFDIVKFYRSYEIINSVFTWYVSSTKKRNYSHTRNTRYTTTSELLQGYLGNSHDILSSNILYNNFYIRNSDDFITSSNTLCTPAYFVYSVKNINNKIIQAISGLDIPELNEITEMLNADAIDEAADKIGIKTKNVIDVFEHILGEQYNNFRLSVKVLHFINQQKENSIHWKPLNNYSYKKEDLLNFKPIEYRTPHINEFLKKYEERYNNIKSESINIIERIRTNLLEGECPICVTDLNEERGEIIIFKCCNTIICGKCCFNVIFKNNNYISNCANCRSPTNIKEIVYLNNLNFEYDKLVEQLDKNNIDEVMKIYDVSEDEIKEEYNKIDNNKSKVDIILDILQSKNKGREAIMYIPNLITGPNNAPFSNNKKILVFGNYDSALSEIKTKIEESEELKNKNFKLLVLNGTYKNIEDTALEFNNIEKNCILFINSMKHCSGLNLQTATELIFTHKIVDPSIESQVVGRAQRLFRTSKLYIHFIMYENEINKLNIQYI